MTEQQYHYIFDLNGNEILSFHSPRIELPWIIQVMGEKYNNHLKYENNFVIRVILTRKKVL